MKYVIWGIAPGESPSPINEVPLAEVPAAKVQAVIAAAARNGFHSFRTMELPDVPEPPDFIGTLNI